VSAVGQVLLRYGELPFRGILNFAKHFESSGPRSQTDLGTEDPETVFKQLNESLVRSALLTLIRHDMVLVRKRAAVTKEDLADPIKAATKTPAQGLYFLDPRRVLMLPRIALFQANVLRLHGDTAQFILEEVALMGSDSKEGILDHFALRILWRENDRAKSLYEDILEKHEWHFAESDATKEVNEKELLEKPVAIAIKERVAPIFDKLVHFGVLVPHRKFTMAALGAGVGPETEHAGIGDGPKKRKAAEMDSASLSQLNLPYGKARPMPMDGYAPVIPIDKERKHATWFKLNWNYFLYEFRGQLVARYWGDRVGSKAMEEILLRVLEHDCRNYGLCATGAGDPFMLRDKSVFVSADFDTLPREDRLTQLLEEECQFSSGIKENHREAYRRLLSRLELLSRPDTTNGISFVTTQMSAGRGGRMSRTIQINFEGSMKLVQQECALRLIQDAHGIPARRIIRMLQEKGALEQKDIADFALLDPKEARSIVHELSSAGYLYLEEAPKRPDMNPNNTSYLFRIKDYALDEVPAKVSLQTLLNLRVRQRAIYNANTDLLNTQDTEGNVKKLPQYPRIMRATEAVTTLYHAIHDVDKTVIISTCFNEFQGMVSTA